MQVIYSSLFLFVVLASAVAQAPRHDMSAVKPVWNPVGPNLLPGAEIAVLQGDLGQPGVFTIRLKMPKGYVVAPHYHGTDLHVTVISGEFSVAMGDRVDLSKAPILRPGDFITVPAQMHHFDAARSDTVVQIYGMGPFSLTYVNPEDDPQRKQSSR